MKLIEVLQAKLAEKQHDREVASTAEATAQSQIDAIVRILQNLDPAVEEILVDAVRAHVQTVTDTVLNESDKTTGFSEEDIPTVIIPELAGDGLKLDQTGIPEALKEVPETVAVGYAADPVLPPETPIPVEVPSTPEALTGGYPLPMAEAPVAEATDTPPQSAPVAEAGDTPAVEPSPETLPTSSEE